MALENLTQITSVGISTGITFSGVTTHTGTIKGTDADFTGNVSVGGTLTYEDVTSIESVGIITAKTYLHVGAGVSVVGVTTSTGGFVGALTGNVTGTASGNATLSNNADNRVITGGSGNALNGESSLTFDGTTLTTTQFNVSTGANAFETSANVFKGASGQKGVYLRSALSSATTPSYSSVDDTNTGIFLPGSDVFAVTTGGTERVRIDNNGKIGIGVNAPAVKAHFSDEYTAPTGGFDSNVVLAVTKNAGASSYAGIAINSGASGGSFIHFGDTGDSNIGRILYESDNSMRFTTNNSEQLRIDSNGRLKINHTNTSGQLDDTFLSIYDANSQSGISRNYAMINLHNYGSGSPGDTAGIGFGAGSSFAYTKGSIGFERTDGYGRGALVFCTNNDADTTLVNNTDERMRITQAGDVAIGKDTAQANYVAGSTTTRLAVVKDSAGSGYHEIANFTAGSDSNNTGAIVRIGHYSNDRGIYIKAGRGISDQAKAIFGLRNSSAVDQDVVSVIQGGLVEIPGDVMVHGTVYGGNGGRRNWFDNGDMTIVSRYANCHFAGNYHSYGWVTDRYQNRGTNAQWSQDTNVPAGKGFVYSAKVNSGTGGSLCQSIELTRKGQHGMFANDTYWCVSLWSTQPINRSSNNGFCKDLGSTDYTAFDNVTPSSGNAYQETGETASGTSTGTFKRYYHVFQAPNSLSSNAFAVNFGWSINYSGSGGCYLTGFQCEQVPNANCKPSAYEHVDQATQLKRCQRYAFRQSDNSSATGQNPGYTRLINGYKRHDDDVHFNFFCPVPMTPYNNSSPPQGLSAWDVGTCTNMGGNLGGTVSNVRLA